MRTGGFKVACNSSMFGRREGGGGAGAAQGLQGPCHCRQIWAFWNGTADSVVYEDGVLTEGFLSRGRDTKLGSWRVGRLTVERACVA